MPPADRDANASGRSSRASNVSAASRGVPKSQWASPHSDIGLLSTPGVANMLRSSTELGDIGNLAYDPSSHMPNVPRGVPRRTGASSRMSTGSSHSNASKRTSSHQGWPSAPTGARRSSTNNVPQYVPDTLSPTILNLPGSSPLIPRSRSSRDVNGRSRSMTYTRHPSFRLSSNRSYASLQGHEPYHRPRSPYHYPTRLRRPGYRPVSPALSDTTGTHAGRSLAYPGQARLRTPSGTLIGRDDRPFAPQHQGHEKSPAFLSNPYADIPPVPPLQPHMVVDNTRKLHRSTKGSTSSGSTNRRIDSDVPSSDGPSPPTPSGSMDVLVSPTGTQLIDNIAALVKGEAPTGPLYYDYSEQFERDQYAEPESESNAVPTGFVHRIKTILEERATVEPVPKKVDVSVVQQVVDDLGPNEMDIAELPASPVPRRITRDFVLAALDPSSTNNDIDASSLPFEPVTEGMAQNTDKKGAQDPHRVDALMNRHSLISQADTSILDSSTLNFAVRCSIPMATETEDGMSDLLDGYQHTESRHDNEGGKTLTGAENVEVRRAKDGRESVQMVESHKTSEGVVNSQTSEELNKVEAQIPRNAEVGISADELVEKRSNHAQKSSDEQSFKSCTDLPEELNKDADARSFKTCKDTVTPAKTSSLPASRLPSMDVAFSEAQARRPVSEMPLSSPPKTIVRKPSMVPRRESSFPKPRADMRAHSRLSSRHASTAASISSSIESAPHQPPVVPPRESSSSKEAQRSQAVADFLMRLSRPHHFSKARSGFGLKPSKKAVAAPSDVDVDGQIAEPSTQPIKTVNVSPEELKAVSAPSVVKMPERSINKSIAKVEPATPRGIPSKKQVTIQQDASPQLPELQIPPLAHQHSLSAPSPVIPVPSSVYSPERKSMESRTRSSPIVTPTAPGGSRRDSQTTTHLVWHGRRSFSLNSPQGLEARSHQSSGQDDTTTDLRLSAYRYPLHCLPDLKEESHEDSSLNTSASNLKNSSFRFPLVGPPALSQPGPRMSADETAMLGRRSSTKSMRKSGLVQTRGLPSMNFSQLDLISKLNEAIDMRLSFSVDGSPDDMPQVERPSPLRPISAREIREKYRSFFASLDELERTGDASQAATMMNLMPLKQPCSPKDLIDEIDDLTIPSVGGLTQRLSEFLPSFKEFYERRGEFLAEEAIMEQALEELQEVGSPVPKRSSARLRPMPGSPNLVVVDDGLYEELTGKEKENDGVAGHVDGDSEGPSDIFGVVKGNLAEGDARAREKTPLAELEDPSPVVLRTRSISMPHRDLRSSVESKVSSRSLRSLVGTPTTTETRPWNSDKNYPWAATLPSIDISFPAPAFHRGSPRPRPSPSPLRLRVSESSASSSASAGATSPITLAAVSGAIGVYTHVRGRSRRLNLFSHSRRATQAAAPGFDASGFPTGPLQVRGTDQTHEAGERYPTSALTPPVNATLVQSNSRSRWSDDSSDDGLRPATSRKLRFVRLKSHLSPSNRVKHPRVVISGPPEDDNNITNLAGTPPHSPQPHEGNAEEFRSSRRDTFVNAKGMSPGAFHGHRILEKLRRWWHRSGDFLRNLSGRRHREETTFPENAEGSAIVDVNGRRIVPLEGTRGVPLWTGV